VAWKRAATIAKECAVSHATASGWLLGSLPRDVKALLRVRDLYKVDIDEWVHGEIRSSNVFVLEKVARAVAVLRKYQKENDVQLEDEQFATLLSMLYENSEKTEFLINNRHLLS
jgi:transcriptional regulator with XRE-family HTH domain